MQEGTGGAKNPASSGGTSPPCAPGPAVIGSRARRRQGHPTAPPGAVAARRDPVARTGAGGPAGGAAARSRASARCVRSANGSELARGAGKGTSEGECTLTGHGQATEHFDATNSTGRLLGGPASLAQSRARSLFRYRRVDARITTLSVFVPRRRGDRRFRRGTPGVRRRAPRRKTTSPFAPNAGASSRSSPGAPLPRVAATLGQSEARNFSFDDISRAAALPITSRFSGRRPRCPHLQARHERKGHLPCEKLPVRPRFSPQRSSFRAPHLRSNRPRRSRRRKQAAKATTPGTQYLKPVSEPAAPAADEAPTPPVSAPGVIRLPYIDSPVPVRALEPRRPARDGEQLLLRGQRVHPRLRVPLQPGHRRQPPEKSTSPPATSPGTARFDSIRCKATSSSR